MKVYDCFTFFNEFDVLEIRINELWDQVDYFVISEANKTHTGQPKPFLLEQNWHRFKQYSEKIRYLKNTNVPLTNDPWVIERWQRTCISHGLHDLTPIDLVIVSDADEIPSSLAISSIKSDTNDYDRYFLGIPLFDFRLNYMMKTPVSRQRNIVVTRGRSFTDPQQERALTFGDLQHLPLHYSNHNFCIIEQAGWHFSYLGDETHAKTKINSFAHTEAAAIIGDIDNINLQKLIESKCGWDKKLNAQYEYVKVDDYFPVYITQNLDKWTDKIIPGAEKTVQEIYK